MWIMSSNEPKLTVSGYRGIWGESLTVPIAIQYAVAYIKSIKEKANHPLTILIGRDGRESGFQIVEEIEKELKKLGVICINGDILPTPTVLFAVRKHSYDGAIIVTASHNPIEYNGLKFVNENGLFIDGDQVERIKKYFDNKEEYKTEDIKKNGNIIKPDFIKEHVDQIIKNINSEKIKSRKFKIAVDMINASACVEDEYLFNQLGVELIPLNNIPNGKFAHKPEPLKENLSEIAKLVKDSDCDIGFAQDPDADRLVVVDEHGEILSEEYTLALGVEAVLSKYRSLPRESKVVVINMSTSQMNADIAKSYDGICIRTKVGEANVVQGIKDNNAIIGGEGGGGIIYPAINTARDSFTSMALILELLAERNQTISEVAGSLPRYEVRKDKMSIKSDIQKIYNEIKLNFNNAQINELDGLRLDFSDNSWIHLRPSNTEPILRLIGEAKTEDRLDELFEEVKLFL